MRIISEEFIIMAHRGASGYELENSYAAFKKAVDLGAPMIETDVRETVDGTLILMHDSRINKTSMGRGKVSKLSIKEIKNIRLKNEENIPVLNDVLAQFKDKIRFNLEIKSKGIETKLYKLIKFNNLIEIVMISSFSFETLQSFYRIDRNLQLALITNLPSTIFRLKYQFDKLRASGVKAINPLYLTMSKSFVKKAQKHDLKVYPWTVNKKETALKLRDKYQVDGLITNFPDILRA